MVSVLRFVVLIIDLCLLWLRGCLFLVFCLGVVVCAWDYASAVNWWLGLFSSPTYLLKPGSLLLKLYIANLEKWFNASLAWFFCFRVFLGLSF